MLFKNKQWKHLFLVCLGILIASAFCMKWMESDFVYDGHLFTIIGLEITYSKEKIISLFSEITPEVRSILGYHLAFDFVFMIGVYPGIAALCMLAREKSTNKLIRNLLKFAAIFQAIAFTCDIIENIYLLKWLEKPEIGNEFLFFHFVVALKWMLAILAALLAILFVLLKRKTLS